MSFLCCGRSNTVDVDVDEQIPTIIRQRKSIIEVNEIDRRLGELELDEVTLERLVNIFDEEMEKGLKKDTHPTADIKMWPTYVTKLPTGRESNDILSLDLGGSNFRVLLIRLRAGQEPKIVNQLFVINQMIMTGPGKDLWGFIANCVFTFMKNQNLDFSKTYPLGFTFSFPCRQVGLSKAILVRWTKGFSCSDCVGEDLVALLQKAIDEKGVKVKVSVLINDTVGCLMSTAYFDDKTKVGLILGTGTNACYTEKIEKIEIVDPDEVKGAKEMLINTEWGAFGENGCIDFILTRYEHEIDKTSINPGKQIFEKMISGMYLGEVTRLMILYFIDRELIFVDDMRKSSYNHALYLKNSFYTKFLTDIEADTTQFEMTRQIIRSIAGIDNPSIADCAIVKKICNSVIERAAKLTAAGLAVILRRLDINEVTVAVDGSLFRYHPKFRLIMEETLKKLIKPGQKFKIALSQDGSGRGAAVVTAVEVADNPDLCL